MSGVSGLGPASAAVVTEGMTMKSSDARGALFSFAKRSAASSSPDAQVGSCIAGVQMCSRPESTP